MTDRPEVVTEDHLEYLDMLRESGATNMFGAGAYLERDMDLSKSDARAVLAYWMETYSSRHETVTVDLADIVASF